MRVNSWIFLVILTSAVVTWIPRILPFVLVKYRGLPDPVLRFLKYLPIAIIFALILSSLVEGKPGQLPSGSVGRSGRNHSDHDSGLSLQNLMGTVLFGIVLVALLRLLVA